MLAQKTGLSNLQKELLKLYSNDVSDETLFEIRLMLSQYFAKKATEAMDKFLDENGIDEETLNGWANEHNRYEGSN
jgi:hypothetical protein